MKKDIFEQRFNSVQLNIVTFVDVHKAIRLGTLDGCVYTMDNSPLSKHQGTPELQTVCKQGQVLNWLIFPMDCNRNADGTWPPSVKINNIVFTDEQGQDVSASRICEDLKIYGGPDKIRSSYTPVYYYWAGTIPLDLPRGTYKYRMILELENKKNNKAEYMNLETLALNVLSLHSEN